MAKLLKLRRGTTTQHASFTGAEGEVTIDTTKDTAVIHDGQTQAGKPLLREDMSNLPAGTIDNADINASAAIAGTKISPNFGSQQVETTGAIVARNGTISTKSEGALFVIYGNSPIEKINVIPKGSIKDLGNSGNVSAFQRNGKAFSLAL